jgi:serine/threonine protein kinase
MGGRIAKSISNNERVHLIEEENMELKLQCVIGFGAFSVVRKALLGTNRVAAKRYLCSEMQEFVNAEARYLTNVSHPNIVSVIGIFQDRFHESWLVMELCGPSLKWLLEAVS